jgi:hypothetical protein
MRVEFRRESRQKSDEKQKRIAPATGEARKVPAPGTTSNRNSPSTERLPRAPSNDGARKLTSQELSYYLSCMSMPPPVALTATPCCVEEMRTITPA